MPKLKPTCPRKTTAGVRGISPVGGKVEELWTMEEKICGKDEF